MAVAPAPAGAGPSPKSERRNGIRSAKLKPSNADPITAAAKLAAKAGVYGRTNVRIRAERLTYGARGVSSAMGTMISSGETPPWRKAPR